MQLVQILLVILGVLVYVTHPQGLYPQGKVHETKKETKQTEKNKGDLEHVNSDKSQKYMGDVPKFSKNNSEQSVVKQVNDTLLKKKNNGSVLNNTVTTNHTGIATNGNLKVNQTLKEETDELTSGAVTRGILVFVAFSFLFILYVGIKTCRRRTQDKRRTIVRKYGIRARRSDVEMEPLPLSDDDDDETVFDLTASRGNHG